MKVDDRFVLDMFLRNVEVRIDGDIPDGDIMLICEGPKDHLIASCNRDTLKFMIERLEERGSPTG